MIGPCVCSRDYYSSLHGTVRTPFECPFLLINLVLCTYRKLTPAVDLASDDDFYHGNSKLPVYSRCATRLDTQELVTILLDPDLKQEKICKTQLVVVEHNAVFIVDLSALECVKDLNCDDMGSWQLNGVYRAWVHVDSNGFVTSHGKMKPTKSSTGVYLITKKYYVHKTSKDLKKTIVFLSGRFINSCCLYIARSA